MTSSGQGKNGGYATSMIGIQSDVELPAKVYFWPMRFSPKKNVGDPIRISVCQRFPGITCPWRPGFEFFVLLIWATFLVVGALVGLVEFTSVLG